jgi:hypothetical protein
MNKKTWFSVGMLKFVIAILSQFSLCGLTSAQVTGTQPSDIRNFGAVCGSSAAPATNAAAIGAALTALHEAFIPACNIYTSNVTLISNSRVHGDGLVSQLVAAGTTQPTGLLNCSTCTGLVIDHINISVPQPLRAAGVSGVSCTNACWNIHITGNTIQGNYGILLTGASNVFVESNVVWNYGDAAGGNISGAGIAVQGTALDAYGYNCGGHTGDTIFVTNNAISGAAAGTASGIMFCNTTHGGMADNTLNSPGYFGITVRSVQHVTVSNNRVYGSVHEGIIVGEGSSLVQVSQNSLQFSAASVDYGLTIDGSQGQTTQVNVTGNALQGCHNSCITLADTVKFSEISGNSIIDMNQSGNSSQAGISAYGGGNQFNTVSGNYIAATNSRPGYLITETSDQTGAPSHNAYLNNAGFNTTSGTYSLGSTSINSGNQVF